MPLMTQFNFVSTHNLLLNPREYRISHRCLKWLRQTKCEHLINTYIKWFVLYVITGYVLKQYKIASAEGYASLCCSLGHVGAICASFTLAPTAAPNVFRLPLVESRSSRSSNQEGSDDWTETYLGMDRCIGCIHIWLQWHRLQWHPAYCDSFGKFHITQKCRRKQISAYSDTFPLSRGCHCNRGFL